MAFISLPGLGCGQFAGNFGAIISPFFHAALSTILIKYHEQLPHIGAVYCNLHDKKGELEGNTFGHIDFLVGGEGNPQQLASPTAHGDKYENYGAYELDAGDFGANFGNEGWGLDRNTVDGMVAMATDSYSRLTGIPAKYIREGRLSEKRSPGIYVTEDYQYDPETIRHYSARSWREAYEKRNNGQPFRLRVNKGNLIITPRLAVSPEATQEAAAFNIAAAEQRRVAAEAVVKARAEREASQRFYDAYQVAAKPFSDLECKVIDLMRLASQAKGQPNAAALAAEAVEAAAGFSKVIAEVESALTLLYSTERRALDPNFAIRRSQAAQKYIDQAAALVVTPEVVSPAPAVLEPPVIVVLASASLGGSPAPSSVVDAPAGPPIVPVAEPPISPLQAKADDIFSVVPVTEVQLDNEFSASKKPFGSAFLDHWKLSLFIFTGLGAALMLGLAVLLPNSVGGLLGSLVVLNTLPALGSAAIFGAAAALLLGVSLLGIFALMGHRANVANTKIQIEGSTMSSSLEAEELQGQRLDRTQVLKLDGQIPDNTTQKKGLKTKWR